MTRLVLNVGGGRSDIRIGVGAFRLEDHALKKRTLILTDRKVQALHGSLFRGWNTLVLDRGEKMKTLAVVERISRALLRRGGDRGATIVGVGGGVICDLAGFAAAVYMRGIRFGFVPTTLLAQADASLGGKNGVNLDRYKNVIGTFRQPDFVLADPRFLSTLPPAAVREGLAEVVKAAAIRDRALFIELENAAERALAGDLAVLERLVARAAAVKIAVVARDERERGARTLLNFGHTFGHALEKTAGLSHGEAISAGMAAAAGDSLGGIVACAVMGLPVGLGEAFFDSFESVLGHLLFSIPGIKGLEFGAGFRGAALRGRDYNDVILDASGRTRTNHDGGLNGGITNGNDVVFRVAVRPTATLGRPQETVDMITGRPAAVQAGGRHDACFALRMPVILEAAAAFVAADFQLCFHPAFHEGGLP